MGTSGGLWTGKVADGELSGAGFLYLDLGAGYTSVRTRKNIEMCTSVYAL